MTDINLTSNTASGYLQADFEQIKDVLQDGGVNALLASINQTATTGNALSVTRDLASGSTDSAVVQITQDNAGDDQSALIINNDGTGISCIMNNSGEAGVLRINQNNDAFGIRIVGDLDVSYTDDTSLFRVEALNAAEGYDYKFYCGAISSATGSTYITRNADSTRTAGPVVVIEQDNAGDDQVALKIQQDGGKQGVYVTKTNDCGFGAIKFDDTSHGQGANKHYGLFGVGGNDYRWGMYLFRDLTSAYTGGPVASIIQTNADDDQPALKIQQDGAGHGIAIDHNNAAGYALDITSVGANQYSALRSICTSTSGYAGYFQKDVATATYPTVSISQLSTTGQQPCLVLDQNDTSEGFIDFLGTDTGSVATQSGASDASVTVELNGTKYKVPLFTV